MNRRLRRKHKPLLIGLAGRARSGKDTVGARLIVTHGLQRAVFADPIKNAIAAMLDMNREALEAWPKEMELPFLGVTPRKLYQTLGTGWGRQLISPQMWITLLSRKWVDVVNDKSCAGLVITDVRMANEAGWIRRCGGVIVHIERDECAQVRPHVSEMPLPVLNGDYRLANNGTVDDLHKTLDSLMYLITAGSSQSSPKVSL